MKLRIEKCIYGGQGLARKHGKAIFVPRTLPGELVEAHLTKDSGKYATADLDTVLEAAAERTVPPCPYFNECGGCEYQHATYAHQVQIKRGILHETLERAHVKNPPEIRSVYAEPFAYRNRIRLHIERSPFSLCYRRVSSHLNIAIDRCLIAAPVLERAIEIVNRIGSDFGLADFSDIEFFTTDSQNELLVSLRISDASQDLTATLAGFCTALQRELPVLTGAAVFTVIRHQAKKTAEWGAQSLTYRVAGRAYRVSLGAFFQVNRFLVDKLVDLVCTDSSESRSGTLAWDLYGGVGLFSAPLSEHFEQVVTVEAAGISSQDLRQNLSGAHCKNITSDTLAFLRQLDRKKARAPDLIVVDPPRNGLGSEVTSLLTKERAKTLVYVSCDPATLSRDLKALVESGYRFRSMHMVDLFPQTFHLESVTVLSLD